MKPEEVTTKDAAKDRVAEAELERAEALIEAARQQAELAKDTLDMLATIELGNADECRCRDLSKDEKELRESAIGCLLHYFLNEPDKYLQERTKR